MKLIKKTIYVPESGDHPKYVLDDNDPVFYDTVVNKEGYFFTSLEIQDIFTIFARENNISQEKVKIFLNDNFK